MQTKAMRDVFLSALHEEMANDTTIFFLAADFGSPILDKIRADYPNRFINVGIAEQNLINVATGLALEGFKVFVYAIAPFVTMRCFEQIRVNVAVLSSVRAMNINIIGVGAGVSYNMSGPTHHCLEDLSIMRTLPNMEVFSPSDYLLAQAYAKRCLHVTKPKYLRFDAQLLPVLQENVDTLEKGFRVLNEGDKVAIVATGYMSHKAYELAKKLNVTLIDLYLLNTYDEALLRKALEKSQTIVTLEEGFENSGGLDAEMNFHFKDKKIVNIGFRKHYVFEVGDREFVHRQSGLGKDRIMEVLEKVCSQA
jgi:transketolase